MRWLALVALSLVAGCDSTTREDNRARCIDAGHVCGVGAMPFRTCGLDEFPALGPCELGADAPKGASGPGVCCDRNTCTVVGGLCVAESEACPPESHPFTTMFDCGATGTKCCVKQIIDAGSTPRDGGQRD